MDTKNVLFSLLGPSDAVILAAGDYPTHPALLQLLRECPHVVCCDSAAVDFCEHECRLPSAVVGDFDSIDKNFCKDAVNALNLVHYAEQETNDLSKAVRYAEAQGWRRLVILGATGKREDHTLGNISLLLEYMRRGLDVVMASDYGVFVPCRGHFAATLPVGTPLSIFAFGAQVLSSVGLRYPLYDFTQLWQGTLNEVVHPEVEISAQGDFLVYVAVKR